MKKEKNWIEGICKAYCAFYKEDKTELYCGAYRFIVSEFREDDLKEVPDDYRIDYSQDEWILNNICHRCEFFIDGCDFRQGGSSPPCGGYTILEFFRKKRV